MQRLIAATWELIAILRTGQVIGRRVEVLRLAGRILSELADLLDDSKPMVGDMPASCPDTIGGCCDRLTELLREAGEPTAPDAVGLNPLVVIVLRRLLRILVAELL